MSQSLVGVVTCVLHKRRQTVTSFCSVLLQFGQLWGTSGGCDSSHFPAEDQGRAGDKPPGPAGISSSPFSTVVVSPFHLLSRANYHKLRPEMGC